MTTTDNRTPNFDFPLPFAGNDLPDDVARIIAALTLIDTRLQEIVNQQQSPDAGTLEGASLTFVLALANATGVLPIAKGGTGATDAAGALAALGFDAAWEAKFAAQLDALPDLLDTLAEITAAIQNNESVGTALTSQIAGINAQITTILATQALKANLHASGNALIIPAAADGDAPDPATAGLLYRSTDSGQVRISDGSAYVPLGGGVGINQRILTASETYAKPANLAALGFRMQAPGGAGGGRISGHNNVCGAGGAGGGYAEGIIDAALLGETEIITVGAQANGVAGSTGETGGTSSIGSLISVTGGQGGVRGGLSGAPSGGTVTTSLTGIFTRDGDPGVAGNAAAGQRGAGGGSYMGTGAGASPDFGFGSPPSGFGSGGGGYSFYNASGGGNSLGQAGAPGLFIIIEYLG